MLKLGFIGTGTVGTALAVRLNSEGYQVVAVSSRSRASAENLTQVISNCRIFDNSRDVADITELVFITTLASEQLIISQTETVISQGSEVDNTFYESC